MRRLFFLVTLNLHIIMISWYVWFGVVCKQLVDWFIYHDPFLLLNLSITQFTNHQYLQSVSLVFWSACSFIYQYIVDWFICNAALLRFIRSITDTSSIQRVSLVLTSQLICFSCWVFFGEFMNRLQFIYIYIFKYHRYTVGKFL